MSFCFQTITQEKTTELIRNLDVEKPVQSADIPTKLINGFACVFLKNIATSINECISEVIYVDTSKKAEFQ